MPKTDVLFYCERDGSVPLVDWLDGLPEKVSLRCLARLERLGQMGHELRRPEAAYLKGGIYELRRRIGTVNYRMLYFFHGRDAVVVSHGFSKREAKVPVTEIASAMRRKKMFEADPGNHTHRAIIQ